MGMSVSPVVRNVLTSVLVVIVSVLSLLAGVPPKAESQPVKQSKGPADAPTVETHVLGNVVTVLIESRRGADDGKVRSKKVEQELAKPSAHRVSISLWPVALFVLFLALGSAGGIFTRTNHLLGVNAPAIAHKWARSKADSLLIIKHLYRRTYGDSATVSVGPLFDDGLRNETQRSSGCQDAKDLQGIDLWNWVYSHVNPRADTVKINDIAPDDTTKLNQQRRIICN